VSVPYTTADLVGGVVEVDDGDDLTPFIRSAHRLIVRFCEPFLNNGTANAYTADDLTDIETWLAAHFYACLSRQTRDGAGGLRVEGRSTPGRHHLRPTGDGTRSERRTGELEQSDRLHQEHHGRGVVARS
jgi:hypothetical protein